MQIHIYKNGENLGPYSSAEVADMIKNNYININDMAWHEGLSQWMPLGLIPNTNFEIPDQSLIDAHTTKIQESNERIIVESDDNRSNMPINKNYQNDLFEKSISFSWGLKNVWVFLDPLIFCYNSYAVFWNVFYADTTISTKLIHSGICLVINLLIVLAYPRLIRKALPNTFFQNFNNIVAYGILIIFLCAGVFFAHSENVQVIEETATEVVSNMLKEEIGYEAPSCVFVKIEKHLGSGLYTAKAMLSTAKEIDITVREIGTDIEVRMTID